MSCGNDALNWAFSPSSDVPEPSVIALMASGLGTGLLGRRVNRRNTGI